jgi:hypothetical protein
LAVSDEADRLIEAAIDRGSRDGVAALGPAERIVYLISEAEVYCDMEGIESFLDNYHPEWTAACADAFEAVGAAEIAAGFRRLASGEDDGVTERLNDLITSRSGYRYEAVRNAVVSRIGEAAQPDGGQ